MRESQPKTVGTLTSGRSSHVGCVLLEGPVRADPVLRAQLLPKLAPDCVRRPVTVSNNNNNASMWQTGMCIVCMYDMA